VEVLIDNSPFAEVGETVFWKFFNEDEMRKIKLLHGLIWLSLSGYVTEDVDSIIGSYCLGLYHLEEAW
jgi:hypothetical protein